MTRKWGDMIFGDLNFSMKCLTLVSSALSMRIIIDTIRSLSTRIIIDIIWPLSMRIIDLNPNLKGFWLEVISTSSIWFHI